MARLCGGFNDAENPIRDFWHRNHTHKTGKMKFLSMEQMAGSYWSTSPRNGWVQWENGDPDIGPVCIRLERKANGNGQANGKAATARPPAPPEPELCPVLHAVDAARSIGIPLIVGDTRYASIIFLLGRRPQTCACDRCGNPRGATPENHGRPV